MTPLGIETAIFRLTAQCVNQQRHRVPLTYYKITQNYLSIFGQNTVNLWLTDTFGPKLSEESSLNRLKSLPISQQHAMAGRKMFSPYNSKGYCWTRLRPTRTNVWSHAIHCGQKHFSPCSASCPSVQCGLVHARYRYRRTTICHDTPIDYILGTRLV